MITAPTWEAAMDVSTHLYRLAWPGRRVRNVSSRPPGMPSPFTVTPGLTWNPADDELALVTVAVTTRVLPSHLHTGCLTAARCGPLFLARV